jgi:hypothetical protein
MASDLAAHCAAFLPVARRYVEWIEHNATTEASPSARELQTILAELQLAALRLPTDFRSCGLSTDARPKFSRDTAWQLALAVSNRFSIAEYWSVLGPNDVAGTEAVIRHLDNDLGDIYQDLMDGILLCEERRPVDALWEWHFSYQTHWGAHLVQAQAAIHDYLADGNWNDA